MHGKYEVLALIPATSDFSLERAVAHFSGLLYSKLIKFRYRQPIFEREPVRAELAKAKRARKFSGFRVYYGDWSIISWLEADRNTRIESQDMAEADDLPAPAEVIAGCSRRLSVWSDSDPEFKWTDVFSEFTCQLRHRFGAFIRDPVNGCWWT
jgi:hypothetical protein